MKRLPRILLLLTVLSMLLSPLDQISIRATLAAPGGASPDNAAPLSYNPNTLRGIADGDPSAGITLIQPPEANDRGEARLSYPIALPQGRNGLEPELSVNYNSAGMNGWMGLGWNLLTSAVTVDTRWGVPRYDKAEETETFMLDGMQLTPLANRNQSQPRTKDKTFYSRVEGAFHKITRHGDSPAGYWWEVVDKAGTRYFYGGDLQSKAPLTDTTLSDASGNIFMWGLREVRDLHGNGVKYSYQRVQDPGVTGGVPGYQLYLKSINYTQLNGVEGPYTVTFVRDDERTSLSNFSGSPTYQKRADVIIDARPGFKMVTASLLRRIEVHFKTELVSSYDFLYKEGAFKKTLLDSIIQSGTDGVSASAPFTHTLSYYDESREAGQYKGFADASTWTTHDDRVAAPGVFYEGQSSALSGAVSLGGGGHIYVGFNPVAPTKQFSGGGKFGFNLNTTEVVLALIDLNGDGLPDKVFRKPPDNNDSLSRPETWPVYFRLNRAGATNADTNSISTTFDTDGTPLPSLDGPGIGRDSDMTFSGGGEVYVVASASFNVAETFTTGSTYFSDVNGDGLPDLVNGTEVLFNYLNNGVPEFTPDSTKTGVPVIKEGNIDATGIISDYKNLADESLKQSPLVDTLRRWEAPFTGDVRIEGTVALIKDESDDRKSYLTADGVRVAIQKNDDELWFERILATDYGPKTPSNVHSVHVTAGDVIYFRVGSVFDGSYDQVAWNPHISYLNVQPQTDVNGFNEYVYRAAEDFVLFGHSDMFVQVPTTGTLRLSGTLTKRGKTSDDVTLLVLKNDQEVPGTSTMKWNETGDFALPPDFQVNANDRIKLRLKADSPIDVGQLQWSPTLFYVATVPPQEVKDTDGNYRFSFKAPYNVDIYPADNLTDPQQPWTADVSGTLKVTPRLALKEPGKKPEKGKDPATGTVVFTVKRPGELLGKYTFDIERDDRDVTGEPLTLEVKEGDRLYFDFSALDPAFAERLSSGEASVERKDKASYKATGALHYPAKPGLVSGLYRGWSYVGYKAEGDKGKQPIDQSSLTIDLDVTVPPKEPEGDYKESDVYDYSDYKPIESSRAYAFAPFSAEVRLPNTTEATVIRRWSGGAKLVWVSESQMSSSRLGGSNVSIPSGESLAEARAQAVPKMSRTSQRITEVGVGFTYSLAEGNSYAEIDYLDMNGDRFPDIVGGTGIQYTTPMGGLEEKPKSIADLGRVLESTNEAQNFGMGGNPASFVANSSGMVGASGEAPRGNRSGSQMVSLGFQGSLGEGTSEVASSLLDINGDGLPDRVYARNGELFARLNLGYSFAAEEHWAITPDKAGQGSNDGAINKGTSKTYSLGVSAGFNGGVYDFGGGVSLDETLAQNERSLADINADGLPDLMKSTESGLDVALNTGKGFEPFVTWKGGPANGVDTSANVGLGGGAYFTIGIGPLCLPAPFCYIIINPGFDVRTAMARQERTLIDMDGDGYPDYVESDKDDSLKVARNAIGRTNLLEAVARPLGAKVALEYKREGNTVAMPQSQWVLSKVSVFDGHVGDGVDNQVVAYSYENGFYNRLEREFYGFSRVIEEEKNEAGATYRSTISDYANNSFYTLGLLTSRLVQDACKNTLQEVSHSYSLDNLTHKGVDAPQSTTDRQFPRLTATTSKFYEFKSTATTTTDKCPAGTNSVKKSTTTTFSYDDLGNVTLMVDGGDPSSAQDDLSIKSLYSSCGETTYVRGLKTDEVVESNGVTLRHRKSTVDCTRGVVTQQSQFLASGPAAVTDLTYFDNGNLHQLTQPANLRGQRYQLTYTYDDATQTYITTIKDSFGYTSSATYNFKFGLPETTTDVNSQFTRYTYDSFGRVLSVIGPYEQADSPTITFEYHPEASVPFAITRHRDRYRGPASTIDRVVFIDGLGRPIQRKQSASVFTGADTASGDVMLVSGRVTFDSVGRAIALYHPVTEALGKAGVFTSTYDSVQPLRLEYDTLDRPTRVTPPDNSVMTYTYGFGPDRAGATQFETTSVDANNLATKTYHDVRNQTVAVKQFNNGGKQVIWTSYSYDALGRITEVKDDKDKVTRATYDNLGRRTSIDTPDSGLTETVYDLASNMVARITPNLRAGGKRIVYDYDFNRMTSITYPDNPANNVSYTYGAQGAADNRAGRLTRVADGSGSTEMFYGRLGEVTKEVRTVVGTASATPGVYTTQYVYDTWGQLQQLSYPDGEVLTYQYDSGGQLRQAVGVKGSFSYRYVNRLEYDKFGDRAFLEAGNGVRTRYAYDPATRMLANLRAGKDSATPFQNINYTYDKVGNIKSLANEVAVPASGMGGPTNQTFQYDDLYRLTGASGSYRYATDKQRTYTLSMSYDTIHNILSKQQNDEVAQAKGKGKAQQLTTYSQNYTYGGTRPHAPTRIGDRTYTYDANGNQTGWTTDKNNTRRNIVWDEENRIQSIFNNGQQLRYTYDAGGERVLKRGPQGETAYVNPYFTIRNADVGTKHIWAGGTRLVSQIVNWDNTFETRQYFYQPDHLGSSNYVTDAQGAIYQHSEYFPFGETWVEESSNTQRTPYLFGGKELDEETGLYYFGARYYDPRTSVWQSTDPIIDEYLDGRRDNGFYDSTNLNLYAYTAQNPLKYVDPDGKVKLLQSLGGALSRMRISRPPVRLSRTGLRGMSSKTGTADFPAASEVGPEVGGDAEVGQVSSNATPSGPSGSQKAPKKRKVDYRWAPAKAAETRPSWRKGTDKAMYDEAPTNEAGQKICPECREAVLSGPTPDGKFVGRNWHIDHRPEWAKRVEGFDPGISRKEVINKFHEDIRAACRPCNLKNNQGWDKP
ncbi:MAG TPA: SpvB/TcaC N-terminal domain-containing protein [Chloroflexia bacterium]|jgi:RHS repeat-associated protein